MERQRMRRQRLSMPLSIVFVLPLLVSGFGHSLLFPANLFLPELDDDAEKLARVQYLLVFFVVLTVLAEIQIRGVEWQHLVKYGPSGIRATARLYRITRWLLGPLLALQTAIFGVLLYDAWSRPDVIWAAMAAAGVATLWFMMFGFAWLKILMGTGISSRSPDVALVRILADAYSAVIAGGVGDFRSFARRSEISVRLRAAALLLEGPMVRMLARDDSAAEAVVRPPLEAAAAGLRKKLAWLATPTIATREELARALGEALIAAATGHLARLTGPEPHPPSASAVPRQSRLVAIAGWCIVALGPATGLWLLGHLISDAATRGLVAQFAALCFVVGIFSIFDPTGRDKLNTVVSVGATLFGWGKPKA